MGVGETREKFEKRVEIEKGRGELKNQARKITETRDGEVRERRH